MTRGIAPVLEPEDTASVRAALEALQAHLRKVADRYEAAAENMGPRVAGSLKVAGVPDAACQTEQLTDSLSSLAYRLRDVADDWASYALDALERVKSLHDTHAGEEGKNG